MLKFTATQKDRLDKFIASEVQVSRSEVQRAIKSGKVSINDKVVEETDFQVKEGDLITLPEFVKEELQASDLDLKIVFENNDLAVIDKPAGLVVHPGAGNKENTLANILISKYPDIRNVGEPHRPGIVHRLDEDTSGLIVIAKTQAAYEFLKNSFLERKVEKEYLALSHGVPAKLHGMIDAPLEKVPLKQKMKVGTGKEALTEYFVLGSDEAGQFSLFRVKLHTGRTHQIRAHLAHIGHPIVGDNVYGRADKAIIDRQFLHAYRLKIQLLDGTWLEVESELPTDLKEVLNKTGINYKL
jgi:23S rRNA pseudouridine1911/1915/1917 synthase